MGTHSLELKNLKVGQRLLGIIPHQAVTVIAITELDEDLIELVYRD